MVFLLPLVVAEITMLEMAAQAFSAFANEGAKGCYLFLKLQIRTEKLCMNIRIKISSRIFGSQCNTQISSIFRGKHAISKRNGILDITYFAEQRCSIRTLEPRVSLL